MFCSDGVPLLLISGKWVWFYIRSTFSISFERKMILGAKEIAIVFGSTSAEHVVAFVTYSIKCVQVLLNISECYKSTSMQLNHGEDSSTPVMHELGRCLISKTYGV